MRRMRERWMDYDANGAERRVDQAQEKDRIDSGGGTG